MKNIVWAAFLALPIFFTAPALAYIPLPLSENEKRVIEILNMPKKVFVYSRAPSYTISVNNELMSIDLSVFDDVLKNLFKRELELRRLSKENIFYEKSKQAKKSSKENVLEIIYWLNNQSVSLEGKHVVVSSLYIFPKFSCDACNIEEERDIQKYIYERIVPYLGHKPFVLSSNFESDFLEKDQQNTKINKSFLAKEYRISELNQNTTQYISEQLNKVMDFIFNGIVEPSP